MPDLSWREATTQVLKDSAEPLHYTEIAKKVVEQGLRSQIVWYCRSAALQLDARPGSGATHRQARLAAALDRADRSR